jgi:hypothetical protein
MKQTTHKIIRTTAKILLIIVGAVCALSLAVYAAVRQPKVQTWIVGKVIHTISSKTNASVSVRSVEFRFFNRLLINDILVENENCDTVLFAQQVFVSLTGISFAKRSADIRTLAVNGALISIRNDTAGRSSISNLFGKKDTAPPNSDGYDVSIARIDVQNTVFKYVRESVTKADTSGSSSGDKGLVSFNNLYISNISIKVNNLHSKGDTLYCTIGQLSGRDHSGYRLKNLTGQVRIAPNFAAIDKAWIADEYSLIEIPHLQAAGNFANFIHETRMQGALSFKRADLRSLAFFVPNVPKTNLPIDASLALDGAVNSFNINKLQININAKTILTAQASVCGLPDLPNTDFDLKLNAIHTTASALLQLDSIFNLKKLGAYTRYIAAADSIDVKGTFNGTTGDFVAAASITTVAGSIAVDALMTTTPDSVLQLQSTISATDIQAGRLLRNKDLGLLAFNGTIEGNFAPHKEWQMQAKTTVALLEYKGYAHKGLQASGRISPQSVVWTANNTDPNLRFGAGGNFQFGTPHAQYNLVLNVKNADLVGTGISAHDSILQLAFNVKAQFMSEQTEHKHGSHSGRIGDMMGTADITDIQYFTSKDTAKLAKMHIEVSTEDGQKHISFASNVADAGAITNLSWQQFPALADMLVKNNFPAYQNADTLRVPLDTGVFDFYLKIKNPDVLCNAFVPNLSIAKGTQMQGTITAQNVALTLISDEIRWRNAILQNIAVNAVPQAFGTHHITMRADKLRLGEATVDSIAADILLDTSGMPLQMSYYAASEPHRVSGKVTFFAGDSSRKAARIKIFPAAIKFAGTEWNLQQSEIVIDAHDMEVSKFRIENQHQFFEAKGNLSAERSDSLLVQFKNIDIVPLCALSGRNLMLSGTLSGEVEMRDLLRATPTLTATVTANNIFYDNKEIGDIFITSTKNPHNTDINVDATVIKQQHKPLAVRAAITRDGKISGYGDFDRGELYYLEYLVDGVMSQIHGTGSGRITLGGTLKHILLTGALEVNDCHFVITYLNSQFFVAPHSIFYFENSNLMMKDVLVHDIKGTDVHYTGNFNNITAPPIFSYNMEITTVNALALNTNVLQNPLYYGLGYGSGTVKISGVPRKCNMEVAATVNSGSLVNFALGKKYDNAAQAPFIKFASAKQNITTTAVKNRPTTGAPDLNANITFTMSPDANVVVTIGSNNSNIITGNGEGTIKMELHKLKNIYRFFGVYTIKNGEYAVSVQNLLNKKFKIESGSRIIFDGPIENAKADVLALYKLRAPLSDLFGDTSPRYIQPVPIECKIALDGKLVNPNMRFLINTSDMDKETDARMQAQFNADNNISMQFFSLLLTGRFMPPQSISGNAVTLDMQGAMSDVLASLAGNFMSQLLNLDVNFRVRTNPTDIGFAGYSTTLSQTLGSRVVFSATLDYQTNRQTIDDNITPVSGNVDLDVLIDKTGKLRVRLFGRTNDQYTEMLSGIANNAGSGGMGLVYQEDFNDFGELWDKMFRRKKKKK